MSLFNGLLKECTSESQKSQLSGLMNSVKAKNPNITGLNVFAENLKKARSQQKGLMNLREGFTNKTIPEYSLEGIAVLGKGQSLLERLLKIDASNSIEGLAEVRNSVLKSLDSKDQKQTTAKLAEYAFYVAFLLNSDSPNLKAVGTALMEFPSGTGDNFRNFLELEQSIVSVAREKKISEEDVKKVRSFMVGILGGLPSEVLPPKFPVEFLQSVVNKLPTGKTAFNPLRENAKELTPSLEQGLKDLNGLNGNVTDLFLKGDAIIGQGSKSNVSPLAELQFAPYMNEQQLKTKLQEIGKKSENVNSLKISAYAEYALFVHWLQSSSSIHLQAIGKLLAEYASPEKKLFLQLEAAISKSASEFSISDDTKNQVRKSWFSYLAKAVEPSLSNLVVEYFLQELPEGFVQNVVGQLPNDARFKSLRDLGD